MATPAEPVSPLIVATWIGQEIPFEVVKAKRKVKESPNIKRYRAVKIVKQGEVIVCGLGDFIHLESGVDDRIPFVARISDLWEDTAQGLKYAQTQWLYRPSDIPKRPEGTSNSELFFTTHNDSNPVEVILEPVRCRLVDAVGKSTVSTLFVDDYRGEPPATSIPLQPAYEIKQAFDHVTHGLAMLSDEQVSALRAYSEDTAFLLLEVYIAHQKSKKSKGSSAESKSSVEDNKTEKNGKSSKSSNSAASSKSTVSKDLGGGRKGRIASGKRRNSLDGDTVTVGSTSGRKGSIDDSKKILDLDGDTATKMTDGGKPQVTIDDRSGEVSASTTTTLPANAFNYKETVVSSSSAKRAQQESNKQKPEKPHGAASSDKGAGKSRGPSPEPKTEYVIPIGADHQASIPNFRTTKASPASVSRQSPAHTCLWDPKNGVSPSELSGELKSVVASIPLTVGKVVVVNVATTPNERRYMVSRIIQLPDPEQWLFVVPFDLAWPNKPNDPQSINVPSLECVFRVHFRSIVWAENYIELATYRLQGKSIDSRPSERFKAYMEELVSHKMGLEAIEAWAESEVVKLWSILYKSMDQPSMFELAKMLGNTKTPKQVAQFICLVANGIVRAPSGTFTCGACKEKDAQCACKFFFKCKSGFCLDCFTSAPKKGLKFIGVPQAGGRNFADRHSVIIGDEMFWICDKCVDQIPANLLGTAKDSSSASVTRAGRNLEATIRTAIVASVGKNTERKAVTMPALPSTKEQVYPPVRLVQYNDGYDPNISWMQTAMCLARGSSLIDAIQTVDEILYMSPRLTYDAIVNDLQERNRLLISNKTLINRLRQRTISAGDVVEAGSASLLKNFLPPTSTT